MRRIPPSLLHTFLCIRDQKLKRYIDVFSSPHSSHLDPPELTTSYLPNHTPSQPSKDNHVNTSKAKHRHPNDRHNEAIKIITTGLKNIQLTLEQDGLKDLTNYERAFEAVTTQLHAIQLTPTAEGPMDLPHMTHLQPARRSGVLSSTTTPATLARRDPAAIADECMQTHVTKVETSLAHLHDVVRKMQEKLNLPPIETLEMMAQRLENSVASMNQSLSSFRNLRITVSTAGIRHSNWRLREVLMDNVMRDVEDVNQQLLLYLPAMRRELVHLKAFKNGTQFEFDQLARQLDLQMIMIDVRFRGVHIVFSLSPFAVGLDNSLLATHFFFYSFFLVYDPLVKSRLWP
jgi:hypothetical protein